MALPPPVFSWVPHRQRWVDPRISNGRSLTASYIDSIGVLKFAPARDTRIHHDPDTLDCLGFLHEATATNRLLRSEEFDNASWTKTRATVTANAAAGADGTTTADKLIPSTDNDTHFAYQDVTITADTVNSFSCFFAAAGYTKAKLRIGNTGDANYAEVTADLSAGTIGAVVTAGTATLGAVSIKYYRRYGLYRVSVACKIDAAVTTARCTVFVLNAAGAASFAGDGTSGVYAWGAQCELRRVATSYIKTTTVTVTRGAESVTVADVSWLSPLEFTLYARGVVSPMSLNQPFITLDDGTLNNRAHLIVNSVNLVALSVVVAGVTTGSASSATLAVDEAEIVMAARVKANSFAIASSINGVANAIVVDTSGAIPSGLTTLRFGGISSGAELIGIVRRAAVYNRAFSDSELDQLMRMAA